MRSLGSRRGPRLAGALASLLLVAPLGGCPGHVGVEARTVSFAEAEAQGLIERRRVAVNRVSRPGILLQRAAVQSDPLTLDPGSENWLLTAVALRGKGALPESERAVFRVGVSGPGGQALLREKAAPSDFLPGRWLPLQLRLPAELGSPLRISLEIERAGSPGERMTPVFAEPRLLVPVRRPRRPLNVLLIVVDTLRADRTEPYGYERPTSPALAAFAERGVVVDPVVATWPGTLISHWSMFTGHYPTREGTYDREAIRAAAAQPLAEVFGGAGYRSAAITEGGFVLSYFGFARGFDEYDDGVDRRKSLFSGRVSRTFEAAISWLRQRGDAPYFLFVHTYQVHTPYDPPAEFRELFNDGYRGRYRERFGARLVFPINEGQNSLKPQEIDRLGDLYDAEIRFFDDAFERFALQLEALGALDDTLVVITSDHGEDLLEHGWLGHGTTLYEPALRVPLVFVWPGELPAGRRVNCPHSLVDLAPTLLDLAGIPIPSGLDGRSFVDELRGAGCGEERAIFSELHSVPYERDAGLPAVSARHGDWKLIYHVGDGRSELYDLSRDPLERQDLAAVETERVRKLTQEVQRYLASAPPRADEPEPLDPEVESQLRELGYVE